LAAEQGLVFKKPLFRPLLKISNVEHTLTLVKPLTYMNNSGVVLPGLLRRHKLGTENLVVVCDNLDLPAGMCRLKRGKGDAGHNGLKSIISCVGSADFLRLYIGVGHPGRRDQIVDWVLGKPDEEDFVKIDEAASTAATALSRLLTHPVEQVMNELNRKHQ
jgi:peptidyl-tRNA hydrolase, PTH1 family